MIIFNSLSYFFVCISLFLCRILSGKRYVVASHRQPSRPTLRCAWMPVVKHVNTGKTQVRPWWMETLQEIMAHVQVMKNLSSFRPANEQIERRITQSSITNKKTKKKHWFDYNYPRLDTRIENGYSTLRPPGRIRFVLRRRPSRCPAWKFALLGDLAKKWCREGEEEGEEGKRRIFFRCIRLFASLVKNVTITRIFRSIW